MIDFANLKYLEIPEGEVIEVKRGDELLWSKPLDIKPYTELLYLESTGTQWIDTGIIPTSTTIVEVKMAYTTNPAGTHAEQINGVSANGRCAWGYARSISNQNFYVGIKEKNINTGVPLDALAHTFIINQSGSWSIDDNVGSQNCGSTIATKSIWLFGRNVITNAFDSPCSEEIYYCKIWHGDALVRELVPVLDADNTPCMYDKISNEFFYNQGTGDFLYERRFEDEYETIDCLESTGREFIDTEMTIDTNKDVVEIVYQSLEDVKYKWIFGEHDTNARFGVGTGDGSGQRNVAYGTGTAKVADSYIFNNPHTLLADTTGVYIDDKKITSYKAFASTSTIYLFNLNLNGTNYCNKARIYSYKHWRDGELVREMIPVRRLLDGEAGLYDKVEKVFYPLFSTFNLRREPTEEEMYQIWIKDSGESVDDLVVE